MTGCLERLCSKAEFLVIYFITNVSGTLSEVSCRQEQNLEDRYFHFSLYGSFICVDYANDHFTNANLLVNERRSSGNLRKLVQSRRKRVSWSFRDFRQECMRPNEATECRRKWYMRCVRIGVMLRVMIVILMSSGGTES